MAAAVPENLWTADSFLISLLRQKAVAVDRLRAVPYVISVLLSLSICVTITKVDKDNVVIMPAFYSAHT